MKISLNTNNIFKGDRRSSLIKKNILWMFLIKGWYGVIFLLLVPLTLSCLGVYSNGLWMTISAALLWIDNLDIGLGNGLRNKLAEHLAKNELEEAKACISSTFIMLICVIVPVIVILIVLINAIDLYSLLHVNKSLIGNLNEVVQASLLLVGTSFIFKFVGNFYYGLQLPAVSQGLVVMGQTIILAGTYILDLTGKGSLMSIAILNTGAPLLVYLISYPITFWGRYSMLRPSFKLFNKSIIYELLSLGIRFFVLQIASAILFTTSNIIVSNLFTPEMVTPFQITFKYFNLTLMIFTVIATPFWSATTDSYTKGDFEWIKRSMKNIKKVLLFLTLFVIVLILLSSLIYKIWVPGVTIPTSLTYCMGLYTLIIMYSSAYSYFLNGFGKLTIQLICTCTAAILFIPIDIKMGQVWGINGVVLAMIIVNVPGLIFNITQYNKIVNHTAKGIWLR